MDEQKRVSPTSEATEASETAADVSSEPAAEAVGRRSKRRSARQSAKEVPEEPAESGAAGVAGRVAGVAEPVLEHVVEPLHGRVVGPMAGALGTVLGAANQAWSGREAIVGRRLRRRAKEPLVSLYELYPEARLAAPRELGLRFVPLEEIRGTAVAGAAQRGGDFLPLKPFRSENWEARWRRIRLANERLIPLPPVDLVKYDGEYWVVDGHNRVATALYAEGAGLDAMVTELVPLDGQTSERPSNLLSYFPEASEMRAAAQGLRPAIGMHYSERHSDADPEGEADGEPSEPTPEASS
jgi:hypothetical protein